jgi:GNAT superfamily N-acetyltransferase
MEPVTIRSAQPADAERLIDILAHGALVEGKEDRAHPETYVAALAEIQSTPGNDVLVAELDGTVVGMCQLIIFRHIQAGGGRCAEIESMHVHPDVRSHGIGEQLLNAALESAHQAGCYRVQLTSNLQRTDAHRFYVRHGFEPSHVGFKRLLKPDRNVGAPGAE